MSTFWDDVKKQADAYVSSKPVTLESLWDTIPEKALVELGSDCVHIFTIPTGAREVIGQCSKCNGERWFKNYYEPPTFNSTSKPIEQIIAENDMQKQGIEITNLDTVGGTA